MGAPNVVRIHPEIPHLSPRANQHLAMIDLLRELDPDSQQVVIRHFEVQTARLRRHSEAARVIRGERGPVRWHAGRGRLRLSSPEARRWLYARANS